MVFDVPARVNYIKHLIVEILMDEHGVVKKLIDNKIDRQ